MDAVKLFPPVSTRETFIQTVSLNDEDTGDVIALVDDDDDPVVTIKVELQLAGPRPLGPRYPYYDDPLTTPELSASIGSGITIMDDNTFEIRFTKTQMASLMPGTYDLYCTIADADNPDNCRTLILGRVPVLYGGRNT